MSHSDISARAMLDAWREGRADRLDPIRFHFMDALAARAASHEGEVRRILEDRLSQCVDAYARDLQQAAGGMRHGAAQATPEGGALGELADYIAHRSAARDQELSAHNIESPSASYPTLAALDDFKKLWTRVRAGSQLRQSLEQVPENAGPLNSGALVHRSIALMRELSPGYLEQFLSYVDALSWLEQINNAVAPQAKDAPRAPAAKKRTRSKSRTT